MERDYSYCTPVTVEGRDEGMTAAREWRDRNRNVVWQPVFEQRPLRRVFTEHMPFKGHRTCAEWLPDHHTLSHNGKATVPARDHREMTS